MPLPVTSTVKYLRNKSRKWNNSKANYHKLQSNSMKFKQRDSNPFENIRAANGCSICAFALAYFAILMTVVRN